MSQPHLIGQAPVTLFKSEALKPLKHNKGAQEFQESLQVGKTVIIEAVQGVKICKLCLAVKCYSEFRDHPTARDGKRGKCRACESEIQKARYHNRIR